MVVIQCACVCVCARARSAGGGRVTCVSCVALVLGVRLDPQSVRFESRVDTLFFLASPSIRVSKGLRRLDEARRAVRPTDERGEPGSRRCARVWSVWERAAAVRRGEAGG